MDHVRGALALCAGVYLGAGCIATEPAPVEGAAAGENLNGKTLTLTAIDTIGWPAGTDRYDGRMFISTQNDSAVEAKGNLLVLREASDGIDLEIDQSFGQYFNTDIAMIVLHRDRAAGDAPWSSITCGDEHPWERAQNGYRFIDDDTHVDLRDRKIVTRPGPVDFASCGITEQSPEIAVFVMPWQNNGNMSDEEPYTFTLWAKCDGGDCGNTGSYSPARFANNPAPVVEDDEEEEEEEETDPDTATPLQVVKAYYQALGEGKIDDLVGMWVQLSSRRESQLRRIAAGGRGWTFTIDQSAHETIASDDRTATVSLGVNATRSGTCYRWTGTISLVNDVPEWLISAMQLQQATSCNP